MGNGFFLSVKSLPLQEKIAHFWEDFPDCFFSSFPSFASVHNLLKPGAIEWGQKDVLNRREQRNTFLIHLSVSSVFSCSSVFIFGCSAPAPQETPTIEKKVHWQRITRDTHHVTRFPHVISPAISRSRVLRIFPVVLRGSAGRNSIRRGTL
jgi:hypothetical protein